MTFTILVSSAVVSAVITLLGNIITAKITQKAAIEAAKKAANHEIDKMERIWQREDIVSSDEEFAEMASIVAKFVSFKNGAFSDLALEKVAAIRSKESGDLGSIMDNLYKSVLEYSYAHADKLLTQAINEKRRIKNFEKQY